MFKNSKKAAISKHFLISLLFAILVVTSVGVSMDSSYAHDLNQSDSGLESELNIEDKLENSHDEILTMNVESDYSLSVGENNVVCARGGGGKRAVVIGDGDLDEILLGIIGDPAESAGNLFNDIVVGTRSAVAVLTVENETREGELARGVILYYLNGGGISDILVFVRLIKSEFKHICRQIFVLEDLDAGESDLCT